jgi:flagellin
VIQGIHTNLASLNSQRHLGDTRDASQTATRRLSSGVRVNNARDDAAGMAITQRMSAQERGMNVATRNAADALSLAQVAESALGAATDLLQRMREIAVQAADSANTAADRDYLDHEYKTLANALGFTLRYTKFNDTELFREPPKQMSFQVGASNDSAAQVTFSTRNLRTHPGIMDVIGTPDNDTIADGSAPPGDTARTKISQLDRALELVDTERVKYGALLGRFESVVANLQVASENQSAARSRIMDADFAKEAAAFTRARILQQAGTAMLAQANAAPQSVLSLLRA